MKLYNNQKGKLSQVKEKPFKLEKHMQQLTEENLSDVFSLQFVKSEFSILGFRIDTLAFDQETSSFVIIEYKRDRNFSVVDQGYAYLSLMLNNKADFILEYNESARDNLRKDSVDWSQSRVLFIAPAFTDHQKQAINFKDLPLELWEMRQYSNDLILYQQIEKAKGSESIKTITRKKEPDVVEKEIEVYTEDQHLAAADESIKELYEALKRKLLELEEFEIVPRKVYIAYKFNGKNIIDLSVQKKQLRMWINVPSGQLVDPSGIATDVKGTGRWGNGDYEVNVRNDDHLEEIIIFVKQALRLKES